MTTINPTTRTFPRHSRPSGTQYASAVERRRANDHSGIAIVFVCGVIIAVTVVTLWVRGAM